MIENVKDIIENFNKDFNVNIKVKDTIFLRNIFQNFININMSSMINNETNIKIVELEEKIQKILSEDKKLFNEFNEIQDNYWANIVEQAFVYGFCMCKQLETETRLVGDKSERRKRNITTF